MRDVRKPINHEKIMLGDALDVLVNSVEQYYPSVNETTFKTQVAPLLSDMSNPSLLVNYQRFVGLLTSPLRVVEDNNISNTLFVIPAIVQSPRTSIPLRGGLTVDQMYQSMTRHMELGQIQQAELKILSFLTRMTVIPDYKERVLAPLRDILARYGFSLTVGGVTTTSVVPTATAPEETVVSKQESSFLDEYEDD